MLRSSEAAGEARRPTSPWRALNGSPHVVFSLLCAVFVAAYWDSLQSLVLIWWNNGTYQFAFLVFPVSAAVAWMQRGRLARLEGVPAWGGLGILLVLALLWMVGAAGSIKVIEHFCVISFVPALVYSAYGGSLTRALLFPLAYLYFAWPVGDIFVEPLRDITAFVSVFVLQLTSIPVFLEGRIILTPASAWHVAEACSGVKFFYATAAFGAVYAYIFFQSTRRRLLFFALSTVVPVLANGLRVFFTIVIGEVFGVDYATGTDHMVFGWQFFGGAMLLLFFGAWPWHQPQPVEAGEPPPAATDDGRGPSARMLQISLVGLVVLLLAPIWLAAARAWAPAAADAVTFPRQLGNFSARNSCAPSSRPGWFFETADPRQSIAYENGSLSLCIRHAQYHGPPSGRNELITTTNRIFDPMAWEKLAASPVTQPEQAMGMRALRLRHKSGGRELLVWYGYLVNNELSTSPASVKLRQIVSILSFRPLTSGVVIVSSDLQGGDVASVSAELMRFLPDLLNALEKQGSADGF